MVNHPACCDALQCDHHAKGHAAGTPHQGRARLSTCSTVAPHTLQMWDHCNVAARFPFMLAKQQRIKPELLMR